MSEAESKRIFQSRFNELLDSRHISQKEIASICKVSTSTVSTWSKGINMPRMDKIERLSEYFSIPKSYFIEENAADLDNRRKPNIENAKIALFGGDGEVTDEMWEEAVFAAQLIKDRYKRKKDQND